MALVFLIAFRSTPLISIVGSLSLNFKRVSIAIFEGKPLIVKDDFKAYGREKVDLCFQIRILDQLVQMPIYLNAICVNEGNPLIQFIPPKALLI